MTVVVRRPGGPLAGLVTSITYRTGEQPRTSVEKILPSPETGLWVNLNRDAFRSFGWSGDVRQVPGTMVSGPAGRAVVMEFEEGHGHVAVLFALGAASRFLGVPASVLCDDLVPLPELWGASPKRFARTQRLKRVVAGLDGQAGADWAAVAFRHGYADQPHLADEFRELAGVTPTGYLRSRVNGPNHVRFDVRA